MGNISTYLQQIMNAVYGEQVRSAIHDAINQCYIDASAGITPTITVTPVDGGTRVDIAVGADIISFVVQNGTATTQEVQYYVTEWLEENPDFYTTEVELLSGYIDDLATTGTYTKKNFYRCTSGRNSGTAITENSKQAYVVLTQEEATAHSIIYDNSVYAVEVIKVRDGSVISQSIFVTTSPVPYLDGTYDTAIINFKRQDTADLTAMERRLTLFYEYSVGGVALASDLDDKVDKVTGKGLSTEDYTTAEKTKLAGLTQIEVDDTLSIEGRAADAKKTGDKIAGLKEDLNAYEDGTAILVEKGYFTNGQKAVDGTAGFDTAKFDVDKNVLNASDIRPSSGVSTVGIGFVDFGATTENWLIDINTHPYLIYEIDSDIPDDVTINLNLWFYTEHLAYSANNLIPITVRNQKIVLNLKEYANNKGLASSYHFAFVRALSSESFTYASAVYLKAKIHGFFTEDQVVGMNLAEKMENITSALQTLDGEVERLKYIIPAISEKSETDAPITINAVDGILQDNGNFTGTSNFVSAVTNKIKCSQGDVFYYFGQCSDSVVACMWFDADGNIIGTVKPSDSGYYKHVTFTAPADADTVIFTSYTSKSANIVPALIVTQKTTYISPLSMKKWYPCGDSFTAGEFASAGITDGIFTSGKYIGKNKTYPYHIGNRTNADVWRGSTSGETLAMHNGNATNFSNPDYAYGYTNVADDADYVTLYFGINDSGWNIPIGTIDDTSANTFYGAWNVVLDDFTTRLYKAHIGIIVSNNLAQAYVDATIAIAKKWGIPYLDLNYDESVPLMHYSLRPAASDAIKAKRNAQFAISEQNHHPNLLAHEYESYFIEKWLLSL